MNRIALIPLDERPVNTRYPRMIGEIAGAEVLLPPTERLGKQREPADLSFICDWFQEIVRGGDVTAVVSCDLLAYGNLINSRISGDSAAAAIGRLRLLEEIGRSAPLLAFSLITRVPNANDNVEEPHYWKEWGTQFYRYANLTHRREMDNFSGDDKDRLDDLAARIPQEHVSDWLLRRLRNHAVNLALIDMAERGCFASFHLTSDDTSPIGFPTRERNWLLSWLKLIGGRSAVNIQLHPGADEVGSALVACAVNSALGARPRVWIDYAMDEHKDIVAPYEDRPIHETVIGQVEACGCVPASHPSECDFVLGVVTPSPRRSDYRPEFLEQDRAERSVAYTTFLARLGRFANAGKPVALADVAYPNGSDPLMSEVLLAPHSPLRPGTLAGYGAWNTAGNTLGTVVAQAACSLNIADILVRAAAQRRFLAHRFLEDYGYQQRVRREAREFAQEKWGRQEPAETSDNEQIAVCRFIEERLGKVLGELQTAGIGTGLVILEGSTRLPWRRTFEVDFELSFTHDGRGARPG